MIKRIKGFCRKIFDILSPGNYKITNRTLTVLIIVVILFICGSFFTYTNFLDSTLKTKLSNNMQVTVDQVKSNLDYRLGQVAVTGEAIWASLYNRVNSKSDIETQLQEYREISALLTSYEGRYMINSIQVNIPDEKIYSQQRDQIYPLSEIEDNIYAQKAGTYWIQTRPTKKSIDVISCAISKSSKFDYRDIAGVLFLNVEISDILKMLMVEYENCHIYLCGSDGKLIVSDDSAKSGEYVFSSKQMENINKMKAGYIDGEQENILIFSKLVTTDWFLILSLNSSDLSTYSTFEVKIIQVLYIIAIFVILVLLLIVAYIMIINSTVDNINNIILDINPGYSDGSKEQNKHNKITFHVNSVHLLDLSVKRMVSATKSLMEEQYKTEIAAKEYQMQALQAQIKPHFLYNTMDSIKWLIKEKDIDNSVSMINDLSIYLRGSINRGLGHVTLHEEIELTKVYISIMRKRFSNNFSVEFLIDDDALKCYIPKLSLQPFIENALLHGIIYCDKAEKKLSVRANVNKDMLEIEIEDNGKGMSKDVLEQIKQQGTDVKKSYGINNVCKRLDLFSKGRYFFNIHSIEGMGTCEVIELPSIIAPDNLKLENN